LVGGESLGNQGIQVSKGALALSASAAVGQVGFQGALASSGSGRGIANGTLQVVQVSECRPWCSSVAKGLLARDGPLEFPAGVVVAVEGDQLDGSVVTGTAFSSQITQRGP
jgi:hypothetical protein